jgi:hypothetical protein
MSHQVYDTTQISGRAIQDLNFNHLDGEEGSGSDDFFLKVDISDEASVFVDIRLQYQSVPPEWVEELFAIENADEISRFKWMYDSIQPVPEMVASIRDTLTVIMTGTNQNRNRNEPIQLFPNPVFAGEYVSFNIPDIRPGMELNYRLNDLNGKIILDHSINGNRLLIPSDLVGGIYFVSIHTKEKDGERFIQKLMVRGVD